MKKIAIITNTNFTNRKGEANAALNRIKYLKQEANYEIDVYNLSFYEGFLMRLFRNTKKYKKITSINIDGIYIKYIWKKFSLLNFIIETKLGFRRLSDNNKYNDIVNTLKSYDVISAHSSECGKIALSINEKYGTPYYVTWHGSDIHTRPFTNKFIKDETVRIMQNASNNFFVSNALLEISDTLATNANKMILYNGVSTEFFEYDAEKKNLIKDMYHIRGKKTIAFIGNLFPIKNVLLLPDIFKSVKNKYRGELEFWIIGGGKLMDDLKESLDKNNVTCKLWGNQPLDKIPDFMNVIDVLVLPSKNEGLPLVTIEALSCGANVVGSNVGGISEAIGKENTFDLDNNFIENISKRIVDMLNNKVEQPLSELFDWSKTAKKENEIYMQVLNNKLYE